MKKEQPKQPYTMPGWKMGLLVYGAIGVFVGPLFGLGLSSDAWRVFALLKVIIFATAFFCLAYIIAEAFQKRWIGVLLTIVVVGLFFWRPIADLSQGELERSGTFYYLGESTTYLKQPYKFSYDTIERVQIELDTIGGQTHEFNVVPSRYDSLMELQDACQGSLSVTFLEHTRKIIDASCR